MNTSSHNGVRFCELDHTAPQVHVSEEYAGELHPRTFSPMRIRGYDTSYDGLQHYVSNDTTLQVVPHENSLSQSAPKIVFSTVGKEVVSESSLVELLRSGISLRNSERVKRKVTKLPRWLKIITGLSGIAILVIVIVVTIIEVRRSRAAHGPSE